MKKAISIVCVLTSTTFLFACESVPNVEDRLQSLQFYPNMYVVQAGETMETIAFRYQLTTAELEALNPGMSSNFGVGMRVNVKPGTVLSGDVRSRARVTYGAVQQPQIVSETQSRQINPQQQQLTNNAQVVVSPTIVPSTAAVVTQRQIVQPATNITEIPATSWSNEQIVVENGNFTEEIIPDTLDYSPVETRRAAMNTELGQLAGQWTWPTQGPVAKDFAPNEAGGQGIDIAGAPGQDIRAAMAGTVVYSGRDLSGGGNLIIVRHNDELMTTYSHADQLFVAEDDQVMAGDPIASLGWNAEKMSVLRFEVRQNGNPLNPINFLP